MFFFLRGFFFFFFNQLTGFPTFEPRLFGELAMVVLEAEDEEAVAGSSVDRDFAERNSEFAGRPKEKRKKEGKRKRTEEISAICFRFPFPSRFVRTCCSSGSSLRYETASRWGVGRSWIRPHITGTGHTGCCGCRVVTARRNIRLPSIRINTFLMLLRRRKKKRS